MMQKISDVIRRLEAYKEYWGDVEVLHQDLKTSFCLLLDIDIVRADPCYLILHTNEEDFEEAQRLNKEYWESLSNKV